MRNIFTFGHSSRTMEDFKNNLKFASIDLLVDIRLRPQSQYQSQFNRANLEKEFGDKYLFSGDVLGGSPKFHNDLLEYIKNRGENKADTNNNLNTLIDEPLRKTIFSKEPQFSNDEKRKIYITKVYLSHYYDSSRRELIVKYLKELLAKHQNKRICFFCSEKNPLNCHRYHLLEKDWLKQFENIHVIHLEDNAGPQGRLL